MPNPILWDGLFDRLWTNFKPPGRRAEARPTKTDQLKRIVFSDKNRLVSCLMRFRLI